MHQQVTETFNSSAVREGICVVDGYGLRVAVERRHLVIADGIGRARRLRRFARGDKSLRKVVVIGNSGTISLDALRWLADVKVPLVHIDLEGRVLAVSGVEGTDSPALRRAQALAMEHPGGLEIVQGLIASKLQGQLRVASGLLGDPKATAVIEAALEDLEGAQSLSEVLSAEAIAASAYWPAWVDVPVRFAKADQASIPSRWLTVGQRSSPLSESARSAAAPAHAILNYCYALLAAEARIACLTMGLDPGLGILHADKANRDSLVADLMEPVRPEVDTFLLELLDQRTFRACDFSETRSGVCRVLAPLTHELAESASRWSRVVGAVTEQVASDLAKMSAGKVRRVSTPITQRSRAAARRQSFGHETPKPPRSRKVTPTCRSCGAPTPRSGYLYCDECRPERKALALAALQEARRVAQSRRKQEGRDSPWTEEALAKQRSAMTRRNREAREWKAAGGEQQDPSVFIKEILPLIQPLSTSLLTRATGLSRNYCLDVRAGKYVPHPRHWEAFRRAGSSVESPANGC
jgi:CRISPR-associated endonuclease Cas1